MVDCSSIIEGTVKFRDGKKWKSRWCVMRKLSPVADCLHLQLYRDSKDRYKQGQTKASLSLQHFLGVESGFTLDKESNTIAIICQDVIVVLAFDTRERLIQWQVKISTNLGEDQQFLILISTAPSKAKLPSGPARMHIQDHRFCLTTGVPPRLSGFWEIGHLRRYGVVEGRFCFEGGSRCGKGEGLYVLVTDQGGEITQTLQLAAQGKLATKRRQVSRKMSAMDSPRKQIHPRPDTRISDLSCTESFMHQQQSMSISGHTHDMSRSVCGDETCCNHHNNEALMCSCHHRTSSPYWSTESTGGQHNTDLDSNYGCGDTASVSEMHDIVHNETWNAGDGSVYSNRGVQPSLERCMSCISKLGAPSMSRSSTVTASGTPGANPPLFNPAWTMENPPQQAGSRANINSTAHSHNCPRNSIGNNNCDRMSICSSHGSSSGNSEYSVPRLSCISSISEVTWNEKMRTSTSPMPPPNVPPKSPKTAISSVPLVQGISNQCQCPPSRPPKPPQLSSSANNSPIKKKQKKPPMPLPITTPLKPANPSCCCHQSGLQNPESNQSMIGPYENYDIPKIPLLVDSKYEETSKSTNVAEENYDTPKKIIECLASEQALPKCEMSVQTMSIRKPCGCILKFNKKTVPMSTSSGEPKVVDHDEPHVDCPCRRVTPMCWPGNWMTLPYCRKGNGMENTGIPMVKVDSDVTSPISISKPNTDMAIYATVDMTKKTNRRNNFSNQVENACACSTFSLAQNDQENFSNYANIEIPEKIKNEEKENSQLGDCTNYANIDFAHSLEYYENAKELLQRAGITQEEMEALNKEVKPSEEEGVCYTVNNGVKICGKCGHACHKNTSSSDNRIYKEFETSENPNNTKQDDYLMMEPAKSQDANERCSSEVPIKPGDKNFPGYLPMSPITNNTGNCSTNNKCDLLKQRVNRIVGEKSASNPSLVGPAVDRSRKRSDSDMRIPGSAMLMLHHAMNSPYNRKYLMDSSDCLESCRKPNLGARKRSSSADSSRYVEEIDDPELSIASRTTSPSSETLRKCSITSLNHTADSMPQCSNVEHRLSSPCLHQEIEPCYSEALCRNLSIDVNSNETEGEDSSLTSDSLRTQVNQQTVNIRRSSSVPCKSGQNRDSSSSNDSGVSTGSLKHRGTDFAEFELPLTTSMSSRRHYAMNHRIVTSTTNCLHSSLPRRSKSSDPLRELTFQFQKIKVPAKSSSAEAEVPICSTKGMKGFSSPADSSMGVPYIDSRSTSSGTSDMSDYIETLSLSSHSSSDATDLRLIRQPTTTLRPRSGKEYHNIDRSVLMGSHANEIMKHCTVGSIGSRNLSSTGAYANITPVPEKSESPSPGYMSGSSPGQEQATPTLAEHFSFQKTQ